MKFWRALVRVSSIDKARGVVRVVVPGSTCYPSSATLAINILPEEIQEHLYVGFRCHAYVTIDAEHAKDLQFKDWEMK